MILGPHYPSLSDDPSKLTVTPAVGRYKLVIGNYWRLGAAGLAASTIGVLVAKPPQLTIILFSVTVVGLTCGRLVWMGVESGGDGLLIRNFFMTRRVSWGELVTFQVDSYAFDAGSRVRLVRAVRADGRRIGMSATSVLAVTPSGAVDRAARILDDLRLIAATHGVSVDATAEELAGIA